MRSIMNEINISDMRSMREQGMSNQEIANSLGISAITVRRYIGTTRPYTTRARVVNDNPQPKSKTFGEKCQDYLDRQAGKPVVQFEILNNTQSLKGADCTYVVDYLHSTLELDGAVLGKLDKNQISQLIAELTALREKLA